MHVQLSLTETVKQTGCSIIKRSGNAGKLSISITTAGAWGNQVAEATCNSQAILRVLVGCVGLCTGFVWLQGGTGGHLGVSQGPCRARLDATRRHAKGGLTRRAPRTQHGPCLFDAFSHWRVLLPRESPAPLVSNPLAFSLKEAAKSLPDTVNDMEEGAENEEGEPTIGLLMSNQSCRVTPRRIAPSGTDGCGKDTSFMRAMQCSGRNCSPPPDLALPNLVFPKVLLSGGVFLLQKPLSLLPSSDVTHSLDHVLCVTHA